MVAPGNVPFRKTETRRSICTHVSSVAGKGFDIAEKKLGPSVPKKDGVDGEGGRGQAIHLSKVI